jgi:hypothetical protein
MLLLGTIPEWSVAVSVSGWPVPRILVTLALMTYAGSLFLFSSRKPASSPRPRADGPAA